MKKNKKNNKEKLDQEKEKGKNSDNHTEEEKKESLNNSETVDKNDEKQDMNKDNNENNEQETMTDSSKNEDSPDDTEEEQKDPVEALKIELAEQKDKYIRLMAEFDNYKRRTSKEYGHLIELANQRLMVDIIEVRESLERALTMSDKNENFTTFLEGIQLIFNKFDEILEKNGLSVFTEIGDEFNPEIHDALMKTPHEEIPEEHITQIYEKGYTLKKHVIKHAKVIVSSGKPEEKSEDDQKESEKSKSEEKATK